MLDGVVDDLHMRKPALVIVLALTALLVAAACAGESDPTVRVTLEVDTAAIPQDMSTSEALDVVRELVERRLDVFGAEGTVTSQAGTRLIVETSGMTAKEAEDLVGRAALLRFMEAEEDADRLLICRTEDGEAFSAEYPAQVAVGACTTAEHAGVVVWKPATGVSNGEVQALTSRHVQAGSARVEFDPSGPLVAIDFTDEGALLFEQITTRLSTPPRPLAIFLDDDLINAPQITFTTTQTTASFAAGTLDDANLLATRINTGPLPDFVSVVAVETIP